MTTTRQTTRSGLLIAIAFVLAACGSSGAGASATPASAASAGSSAAQSSAPSAILAGQTQTEWGRIWQSLPHGFPMPAGSTPDEDAATPASAVLVVEGIAPKDVSTFLQAELEKAGYTAVGSTEPLEDGSIVLEMTGKPDGCALRVTSTPTGGLTTVTILYGASCPFA